jgi:hypothetical protein
MRHTMQRTTRQVMQRSRSSSLVGVVAAPAPAGPAEPMRRAKGAKGGKAGEMTLKAQQGESQSEFHQVRTVPCSVSLRMV